LKILGITIALLGALLCLFVEIAAANSMGGEYQGLWGIAAGLGAIGIVIAGAVILRASQSN
jgi:hypothetical protein